MLGTTMPSRFSVAFGATVAATFAPTIVSASDIVWRCLGKVTTTTADVGKFESAAAPDTVTPVITASNADV